VLGVEPDARMAERARGHGVEAEVAAFESWADAGRRFDLLTSGQAWHWVNPEAGAAKAAEVLRSGGRFAAFWNETRHTPELRAVFDEVYRRHAPDLLETSVTLGVGTTVGARADRAGAALAAGPFDGVEAGARRRYPWQAEYTPQEWITLVGTHSDHLALDPAVRAALLADLQAALGQLGPTFVVPYRTDLLLAVRR
jgi:SAM-dependent methyltransferase